MKHGSNQRRGRSRGGKRGNPRNHTYESNGPDVKVRGTAQQVLEKYLTLARDASSSGDHITAESYFQFAEHYYRLVSADQASGDQQQDRNRSRLTPADEGRFADGGGDFNDGDGDSQQAESGNDGNGSSGRDYRRGNGRNNGRGRGRGRHNGGGNGEDGPMNAGDNTSEEVVSESAAESASVAEEKPRRGRRPKADDGDIVEASSEQATV